MSKSFRLDLSENSFIIKSHGKMSIGSVVVDLIHTLGYKDAILKEKTDKPVIRLTNATTGTEIELHISESENHVLLTDAGLSHIRLKFDKQYTKSVFKDSFNEFVYKIFKRTEKKTELMNKIKEINEGLSESSMSMGMILKSKDRMRLFVNKENQTIMYLEVDSNFDIIDREYIDKDADKDSFDRIINKNIKKLKEISFY